jgi:hypothetical protein
MVNEKDKKRGKKLNNFIGYLVWIQALTQSIILISLDMLNNLSPREFTLYKPNKNIIISVDSLVI